MMVIDEIIRKLMHPAWADQAAVGAINRPLQMSDLFYSSASLRSHGEAIFATGRNELGTVCGSYKDV